jgi:hypothetical protein
MFNPLHKFALIGLVSLIPLTSVWAQQNAPSTNLPTAISTDSDQSSLNLTIYNQNRALVQEKRKVNILKGQSNLLYKNVSAQIEAQTLIIKSSGDLQILEQNYEYDLITSEKLLDKYVGQKVTLVQEQGLGLAPKLTPATLISNNGSPIFEVEGKILLGMPGKVILPQIPENMAATPSLKWLTYSANGGTQNVNISYLTSGLNWSSDYVLLVDANDKLADLNGWITLNNQSGTGFKNATLKLVAGDVHHYQPPMNENYGGARYKGVAMMMDAAAPEAVQEKTFDEYHLYSVPRPVTVANNQTKQIQLLSASQIKTQKVYKAQPGYFNYFGQNEEEQKIPVGAFLQFKTGAENNLELPLPAGVVRVYKTDSDGSQIFVGEDRINHTPKNEKVSLKTGDAFDIICEYKQTKFKRISDRVYETSWSVKVKNHKKEAVEVLFNQANLYGDWKVTQGPKPETINAQMAQFKVKAPADGEQTIEYTIQIKN